MINGKIMGADISSAQAGIDLVWLKAQGYDFLYVEGEVGNDAPNPYYASQVQQGKGVGFVPGCYDFLFPLSDDPAHPGRDPVDQANAQFKLTGGLGASAGELPPMIDVEWPAPTDWAKWHDTAPIIVDCISKYKSRVKTLWGVIPVIYTYPDFWLGLIAALTESHQIDLLDEFAECPLWMATQGSTAKIVAPWTVATIWQETGSEITAKGCGKTDVDEFLGDLDAFAIFTQGASR